MKDAIDLAFEASLKMAFVSGVDAAHAELANGTEPNNPYHELWEGDGDPNFMNELWNEFERGYESVGSCPAGG